MKGKKNQNFLIFILIILIAILSGRLFRINNIEVIKTSNFSDYFQTDESDNGGLEIVLDNFTTLKKEYNFTNIQKVNESQNEIIQRNVEIIKYKVVSNDTIQGIAKKFNISSDTIKMNNVSTRDNKLKIGETLIFPAENGYLYKIKKNDYISKIAKIYGIKTSDIIENNNINPKKLKYNTYIFLKDVSYKKILQIEKNTQNIVRKSENNNQISSLEDTTVSSSGFAFPVRFNGLASPFGNRFHPVLKRYILHTGVDLVAKFVPLRTSKDGVVSFAGYMNGYGKIIIIKHSDGFETRYAHLSVISTKVGEHVKRGELIGKTGNSGRVTGPHLHFEIRKNGTPINPMKYLR